MFPSSWSHSLLPSLQRSTQFVWFLSRPCTSSNHLTLFLHSYDRNRSFSWIHFGCRASSAVSPHHDCVNLEMYMEAVVEPVWRCTWRRRLSELRNAYRGRNGTTLEAMIMLTWRLWSNELDDVLEGHDRAHLERVIERVWRCSGRQRSSELRDVFGGRDCASLERHSEAMINRDWRCTWRWSIWRRQIEKAVRQKLRLYSMVNSWLWECTELSTTRSAESWEIRDWLGGGDSRS